MKFLKKIGQFFKTKSPMVTNPKDVQIEQERSEAALTEIELRDR